MKEDGSEMLETIDDDPEQGDGMGDRSQSSSETPSATATSDQSLNKMKLATKETSQVFRLRLLVFLVLLLATAAVSVIVYFVTSGSEEEAYKSQFDGSSKLVQETFIGILEDRLSVLSGLGVALSAHGEDHENQHWPFVTLSSFQQRASAARVQSGTLYVQINPYVSLEQREEWEQYVVGPNADWMREDLEYQTEVGLFNFAQGSTVVLQHGIESNVDVNTEDPWPIWYRDENDEIVEDRGRGPYLPTWQTSPVFHDGTESNENILKSFRTSSDAALLAYDSGSVVISEFLFAPPGNMESSNPYTAFYSQLLSVDRQSPTDYLGDPISQVFFPIFDKLGYDRTPVGVLVGFVHWKSYFRRVLPQHIKGLNVVVSDSCGGEYTYVLDGPLAEPVGAGDLHDRAFSSMKRETDFDSVKNIADGTRAGLPLNRDGCNIHMAVYPSRRFYDQYKTNLPILLTAMVGVIFLFTAFMFLVYDRLVERRQSLVLQKALETTAIVTSLFPEAVAERLMQSNNAKANTNKAGGPMIGPNRLKGFMSAGQEDDDGAPIADLFPNCTVLFSDIAGFTAWSSSREPSQVFVLLQTVYQAFDSIAKRRKVFKVETIGDSYLAVTGLPEPMLNHAVVMVRFAWDCMLSLDEVTKQLEVTLGPDTADLTMRFGLHSGPVTAGVLRGERARFQLFGDTVNVASRMESTGLKGRIQVSHTTAKCLTEAGKAHWIKQREDAVQAKGKGTMQTFWANPTTSKTGSSIASGASRDSEPLPLKQMGPKPVNQRLVAWMVELLMDDMKKIVYIRRRKGISQDKNNSADLVYRRPKGATFLEEAKNTIQMPAYDAEICANMAADYSKIQLEPVVVEQLRQHVTLIASLYRNNPFHNFEHACHVTMSVKKLLKRIVTPDVSDLEEGADQTMALHEYTYGLNSDPLTLLAITYSALIHDVDHRGCSNVQLMVEDPELAQKFHKKSVAEQQSLDLAWGHLMGPNFSQLRGCLFDNSESEMMRFRQLMVNVVLATDIFDKELNDLRKERWNRAFATSSEATTTTTKDVVANTNDNNNNLRATIVIEHIIQASDVSHTMQHWHVYQKWNKCLFMEMYKAFQEGRMAMDPSGFWYQGEIGFLDNYVIPLTKKLKDCGVFGVSSDEYLNYAIQNRMEWEDKGEEIVRQMLAEAVAAGGGGGGGAPAAV